MVVFQMVLVVITYVDKFFYLSSLTHFTLVLIRHLNRLIWKTAALQRRFNRLNRFLSIFIFSRQVTHTKTNFSNGHCGLLPLRAWVSSDGSINGIRGKLSTLLVIR